MVYTGNAADVTYAEDGSVLMVTAPIDDIWPEHEQEALEREPPAWLAHEIARRPRLPRLDDPVARAREGGAFLATSRRPSGAASARPVVLHFYSLACRDGVRRRRRERSISFKIRKAANEGV